VEAGAWGWPSLIWETGVMVDVSWEKTVEAARREARKRMLLEVCIVWWWWWWYVGGVRVLVAG
jgi:hypothetical protein